MIVKDQFGGIQNLQRTLIPQTSNWSWTFFCRFWQQTSSRLGDSLKIQRMITLKMLHRVTQQFRSLTQEGGASKGVVTRWQQDNSYWFWSQTLSAYSFEVEGDIKFWDYAPTFVCLFFVCNRGDTVQYYGGLWSRELGQAPMLQVFLTPRQVLSSHPRQQMVWLYWLQDRDSMPNW